MSTLERNSSTSNREGALTERNKQSGPRDDQNRTALNGKTERLEHNIQEMHAQSGVPDTKDSFDTTNTSHPSQARPDSPILNSILWEETMAENKGLIKVEVEKYSAAIPKEYLDGNHKATKTAFIAFLKAELLTLPIVQQQEISCFISYAWGDPYVEYWVEQLAILLKKSGISIYLDKWSDRMGKQITTFIEEALEKADFYLVVGTPLYLEKYRKPQKDQERAHVVNAEVSQLNEKAIYNKYNREKIIPLLLQGSIKESIPFFLRNLGADFATKNYFEELWRLLCSLYDIPYDNPILQKFKFFLMGQQIKSRNAEYKKMIQTYPEDRKKELIESAKNHSYSSSTDKSDTPTSIPASPYPLVFTLDFGLNVRSHDYKSSQNSREKMADLSRKVENLSMELSDNAGVLKIFDEISKIVMNIIAQPINSLPDHNNYSSSIQRINPLLTKIDNKEVTDNEAQASNREKITKTIKESIKPIMDGIEEPLLSKPKEDTKSSFPESPILSEDKDALFKKIKSLCYQQASIAKRKDVNESLDNIRKLFISRERLPYYCFISYAWPIDENESNEGWLQYFLKVIRDHLRSSGIMAKLDIIDCPYKENVIDFFKNNSNSQSAVLLCTKSLADNYKNKECAVVKAELDMLHQKFRSEKKFQIFPLWISGSEVDVLLEDDLLHCEIKRHDYRKYNYIKILYYLIKLRARSHGAMDDIDEAFGNTMDVFYDQYVDSECTNVPESKSNEDIQKKINKLMEDPTYKKIKEDRGEAMRREQNENKDNMHNHTSQPNQSGFFLPRKDNTAPNTESSSVSTLISSEQRSFSLERGAASTS